MEQTGFDHIEVYPTGQVVRFRLWTHEEFTKAWEKASYVLDGVRANESEHRVTAHAILCAYFVNQTIREEIGKDPA